MRAGAKIYTKFNSKHMPGCCYC